jgi:hypothetical protein
MLKEQVSNAGESIRQKGISIILFLLSSKRVFNCFIVWCPKLESKIVLFIFFSVSKYKVSISLYLYFSTFYSKV